MKILALELSSGRGSIAFHGVGEASFLSSFANDRKHSGLFFEDLQRALLENGNPERIVVGLGPGSYAGTRIAIATAIGLQAVLKAELVGISSLCGMATEAKEYCVIGDARRQTFFFAQVRDRRCVKGPELCTESELAERLASTISLPAFSSEALPAFAGVGIAYPSAALLAEVAAVGGDQLVQAPLDPIYLRAPHITYPTARQNLTALK